MTTPKLKKPNTKLLVTDVYMCKNCSKNEYLKRKLRIWCVWCRVKDSIPQYQLILRERYMHKRQQWDNRMVQVYKLGETEYIHKLKMQTVIKLHLTKRKK